MIYVYSRKVRKWVDRQINKQTEYALYKVLVLHLQKVKIRRKLITIHSIFMDGDWLDYISLTELLDGFVEPTLYLKYYLNFNYYPLSYPCDAFVLHCSTLAQPDSQILYKAVQSVTLILFKFPLEVTSGELADSSHTNKIFIQARTFGLTDLKRANLNSAALTWQCSEDHERIGNQHSMSQTARFISGPLLVR